MLQEFRAFIERGNAIDMAVGVILGGAFGKIVTSLVNDMVMPPIGFVVGQVDFKDLALILKPEEKLADGTLLPAVTILYGQFIQTIIDFLLVSLCVFFIIKGIQTMRKQPKPEPEPSAPETPEDIKLLIEIRDLLAKQS